MYGFLQSRKISNNPAYGAQRTTKVNQRYVDANTVGYIANEESTEGQNVGAVFSFAITCDITHDYNYFVPEIFEIL